MTLTWITTPNLLYTEQSVNNKTYNIKVAGFDMDHTIIKPIGNTIHPKNKDDFEYVFSNISEKMIELHTSGYSIIIFSNQDNLNKNPDKKQIVLSRIQRLYTEVFIPNTIPVQFFISIQRDFCRKPNTGMFDFYLNLHNKQLDTSSFYVGDAAGRIKTPLKKKDFSCSDRMFAINCHMNFMTPEKYFMEQDDREFIIDKTFETHFMTEDIDTTKDSMYINWDDIKKYNIVMLVGAPGTGKTTMTKRMISTFGYTDVINMDTLLTKKKCLITLRNLLQDLGKRIVIDNTNSSIKGRKEYLDIINELRPDEPILLLKINLDKKQAFFLNNVRCKVTKQISLPNVAIHLYFKLYEEPKIDEGFTKIIVIPFIPTFKGIPNEKKLFYQYF